MKLLDCICLAMLFLQQVSRRLIHKDQALRMWGYFKLSVEGLIHFFLVRWQIPNTLLPILVCFLILTFKVSVPSSPGKAPRTLTVLSYKGQTYLLIFQPCPSLRSCVPPLQHSSNLSHPTTPPQSSTTANNSTQISHSSCLFPITSSIWNVPFLRPWSL